MHKYLIENLKGLVGKPLLSTPFINRLTLMFSCGTLSVVSWYAAVVLGVWKEANFRFDYWIFVAGYAIVSLGSIFAANILGRMVISHFRKVRFVPERRFEDSVKCSLTGLYNRRMAYELITKQIASSKRSNAKFSLILFDIDHFDRINKEFDDFLADELLVQVAQFLGRDLRETDWLFRFGSDEFLMLLPDCDTEGVKNVASRIQKKIGDVRFEIVSRDNDQNTETKAIHLTLLASAMCVNLDDIETGSGIDTRIQSRLKLVDEPSGNPISSPVRDAAPLMNQTKIIIAQMVDVLAHAKQKERNQVTMVKFESCYIPVVDKEAS
jgi:diguanylate cyclase (GGDEF)-like protein